MLMIETAKRQPVLTWLKMTDFNRSTITLPQTS